MLQIYGKKVEARRLIYSFVIVQHITALIQSLYKGIAAPDKALFDIQEIFSLDTYIVQRGGTRLGYLLIWFHAFPKLLMLLYYLQSFFDAHRGYKPTGENKSIKNGLSLTARLGMFFQICEIAPMIALFINFNKNHYFLPSIDFDAVEAYIHIPKSKSVLTLISFELLLVVSAESLNFFSSLMS